MLQAARNSSNDVVFTLSVETDPRAKAQFDAFKRMGGETAAAMRGQSVPGLASATPMRSEVDAARRGIDLLREEVRLRKEEASLKKEAETATRNGIAGMARSRGEIGRVIQGVESLTKAYVALGIASDGVSEKAVRSLAGIIAAAEGFRGATALGTQSMAYIAANPTRFRGVVGGAGVAASGFIAGATGWTLGRTIRNSTGIGEWIDRNLWGHTDDDIRADKIARGEIEDPAIAYAAKLERLNRQRMADAQRSYDFRSGLNMFDIENRIGMNMRKGSPAEALADVRLGIGQLQSRRVYGQRSAYEAHADEENLIKLYERQKQLVAEVARERERSVMAELRGAERVTHESERQLQIAQQRHESNKSDLDRAYERYGRASPAERSAFNFAIDQYNSGKELSNQQLEMVGELNSKISTGLFTQRGRNLDRAGRIASLNAGELSASQAAYEEARKNAESAGKATDALREQLKAIQDKNQQIIEDAFKSIGVQIRAAMIKSEEASKEMIRLSRIGDAVN